MDCDTLSTRYDGNNFKVKYIKEEIHETEHRNGHVYATLGNGRQQFICNVV